MNAEMMQDREEVIERRVVAFKDTLERPPPAPRAPRSGIFWGLNCTLVLSFAAAVRCKSGFQIGHYNEFSLFLVPRKERFSKDLARPADLGFRLNFSVNYTVIYVLPMTQNSNKK
jgi:hypothetical protein